jgi:cystathionine gamma-synthase
MKFIPLDEWELNLMSKQYKFETLQLHAGHTVDPTGSRAVPIYQTTSFVFKDAEEAAGRFALTNPGGIYSRLGNPTTDVLDARVAQLEGGAGGIAVASGSAAITYSILNVASAGDNIVAASTLYGGTYNLFTATLPRLGIETKFVNPDNLEEFEAAIDDNTKAVYIETIGNPGINLIDVQAVADIAHKHNIILIVDNTFLSPYFQKPLNLGADIVVHSGTKFIGGHHDVISGFTIVKDDDLAAQLRLIYKTVGACLSAFDSWLVIRGVKTLALRMEQHQKNAIALAEWLKNEPKVTKVLFPGLPEHPGYEVNKSQTTGFGGMLSFEVDSEETAKQVLEGIKLIQFAESLGGTESLLTYPVTQTHPDLKPEDAERKGITRRLLRLSVGIEDTDDLIADLAQAFNK